MGSQTLGQDVESIYVEDLGVTMSREDIFKVLVQDPMEGAIEVDWRDFFPYLSWIPNKNFEFKIQQMYTRRKALMKSLIQEQKKRIASGEVSDFTFTLIWFIYYIEYCSCSVVLIINFFL